MIIKSYRAPSAVYFTAKNEKSMIIQHSSRPLNGREAAKQSIPVKESASTSVE